LHGSADHRSNWDAERRPVAQSTASSEATEAL
jgi:hypothetical protein